MRLRAIPAGTPHLALVMRRVGAPGDGPYTPKLIGLQAGGSTASGGYTDTLIAPTGGGAAGHVPSRKRGRAAPLASDLLFAKGAHLHALDGPAL